MIFSDSIPRSSTIFTATRRLSPAGKGRETVPWNWASRSSFSSARMSRLSFIQPSCPPAIGKKTWRGNSERSS